MVNDMKYDYKRVLKRLNRPVGFEIETMTGGIRFTPPAWSWLVLYAILLACIWMK
jgi:hypothetical protein